MGDVPYCDPPIRNLPQWDGRWGQLYVHDKEKWQASGCHPCCVAMVLRWYAEDNAATKSSFKFPAKDGSSIDPTWYPLRMAEAFWPDLAGQVHAINNNVDHVGLRAKAAAALGIDVGTIPLKVGGNPLQTITDALAKGPIVCCITHPGHFVLIHGYRDGMLLITDPGNVLVNDWGAQSGGAAQPPKTQWPDPGPPTKGNEFDARGYVVIDPNKTYSIKGSKTNQTVKFLSDIASLELYQCKPPATTTAAPHTTTTAPHTTTTAAPHTTTTAAHATTTAAPPATTTAAPPATTTAAPHTTTTTAPHATTTAAPAATTTASTGAAAPATTTAAPAAATTAAPASPPTTTTAAPSHTTTAAPAATTTAAPSATTTAAPAGSTTAAPTTTAAPANATTAAPEASTTAAPTNATTAAAANSTTAAPATTTTAAPETTTTAGPTTTTTSADAGAAAVACVDDVRTADQLLPWDLEGNEGRWLEVPRLQQQNDDAPSQSSFWSGRAAAAMLYNFSAKFAKKTDEYIGHATGDAQPGPNGVKTNLRWLGGSNKGVLAGITDGQVDLTQIFTASTLQFDAGQLVPNDQTGLPEMASLYFAPILEQLKINNPVLLFTLLSRGPGHVIVISGYKIIGNAELWIRVTDSDAPRTEYLPSLEPITNPTAPDKMFSEYWVPATAFFQPHPTIENARLYEYVGNPGKYMFVVPATPITDDDELVHRLTPKATPQDGTGDGGGTGDGTGEGTGLADATGGDGHAAGTSDGTGGGTSDGPKPRPWNIVEPEVIDGEFKDAGVWKSGKFTNIDLQGLLEHYCTADSIDPTAMGDGGASKNAKGGDLEVTGDDSLPTWYCTWRVKVAQRPKWDTFCSARSRIGEAFSRWFFRDLCNQKSVPYAPSADEFFANLWKSSANGMSKDMGGPSAIYCAAAASLGFSRALLAAGFKVPPGKGTQVADQCVLGKLKGVKPAPGDVLSLVSPATPRTGHVVTVLVPLTTDWASGSLWVVSGNCGPRGNLAVDFINLEARDPGFNPFKTDANGKIIGTWQKSDKKPTAGNVWIYADQRCSELMPAKLASMSDADLKKHSLTTCPKTETPGSKPGTVKPEGDDSAASGAGTGGDAPGSTTTAEPEETTTEPPATTTAAPAATTTAAPAHTTTAAPAATTTAAPAHTTTAAPAGTTTAAPSHSTTGAPAGTTTAAPAHTTTAAPVGTTTAAPHATTTHAPTTTTHPPTTTTKKSSDKMTSSNIQVGSKHFVDWFNQDFKPQYPGNHPTLLLWKKPAPMFPSQVNKANFVKVFDKIDKLWAPELTVPEFLAFFGIFYNETGGTMQPVGEVGSAKYMFNATPGGKASYNTGGNRKAGDQLSGGAGPYQGAPVISDPDEIAAWNGTVYPDSSSDAVKKAALQCDFYKYRGHGFIQTTFHNAYVAQVDPALKAAGYPKTCDQMTMEDLENTIKTDPNVSLPMVRAFYKANCSKMMPAVNNDPPEWTPIGTRISGQKPYGALYQWRCETIYGAMQKAGITLK